MINKILGFLFLVFVSCNFVNGYSMEYGLTVLNNNTFATPNWDGNMEFMVSQDGILYSQDKVSQIGANLLTFAAGNSNRFYFFFSNYRPYFYYYYNGVSQAIQGFTENYYECVGDLTSSTDLQLCTKKEYNQNDLGYFFNTITNNDKWAYNVNGGWVSNYIDGNMDCYVSSVFVMYVCFYSSELNKSECFAYADNASSNTIGSNCEVVGDSLVDSLNISNNKNYIDLGNYISTPPFYNGGGNGGDGGDGSSDDIYGISLNSVESALYYYENRYGWDENICYVGVDSLDYLYGSRGISFDEGSGLSIFDVYTDLYGSGYDLKWVSTWLNSWLVNYEQWFNSRGINAEGVGHPTWLSWYNSGTHLSDFQFDDFSFPFTNQPVAFYFMSSYIDSRALYSTMGGPVVSYCNIKINSGSFDDIIDNSDKNNINGFVGNFNKNQGLNSDGTEREYGAWLSSGVNIAFSGDVTVKNTLKNFFDQFYNFFNVDIQDNIVRRSSNNPVLPGRLASCLLFVILFKFIRKK